MRTTLRSAAAFALLAGVVVGCSSTPAATSPASVPASVAASPSALACAPADLDTFADGKLTVATDNPAYPPYFQPRDGGNAEPWDPEQGDPTTGEGFESAVAYAIAGELGFAEADVVWTPVPFNNSFAPGPKEFDFFIGQVGFKEERTQGADLSEGYYFGNQSVVVMADGDLADATTIAALKDATLGAQVGTTSLDAIEDVIQTTAEAAVYNTTDDAIEAMVNGQIDGIVVDLPTAGFITSVQIEGGKILGQLGEATGAQPEQFSVVLDLDSPLTGCVNQAIASLTDDGTIPGLIEEWLPFSGAPELQP